MKYFPSSTLVQLEYEKVKALLVAHCKSQFAIEKAEKLRLHTKLEIIETQLNQTNEYKLILQNAQYFPNCNYINVQKEIKLIGIPGASLSGEQWIAMQKMLQTTKDIFRWMDKERQMAYPNLYKITADNYYEKTIAQSIEAIIDEQGQVKDSASESLAHIRLQLYRKRNELRSVFNKIVAQYQKLGFVTDIEESFLNGRKVIALFAENKRQVKGIIHGESDTRKTAFIEPEETIELNNDIFVLENDERKEVHRILLHLTATIHPYATLLKSYVHLCGNFDFIHAKAKLAIDMEASLPLLSPKSVIDLQKAYHPLLFLYNKTNNKPTIPTTLQLDASNRIIVISGPNAGGKTVTMKTVGLLQLMMQSGLLVPVSPESTMGIFTQIMIHIGDTQSLEFELSTYSSHLKNMKYFLENANGRTLFFIDELGGGSDPSLGGAFAEVILQDLASKHAVGIVTTHYLNLKVMANNTQGLINASMAFDETNLMPLYKLIVGKPGSSYTFSIAERIGLDKNLIADAKKLVNNSHYKLDKLLNNAEQDLQKIAEEKTDLNKLLLDNERLNAELKFLLKKEKHKQQLEIIHHQNKIAEEKINAAKDIERKLKQASFEWKNNKNKSEVMKQIEALLFNKKTKTEAEKQDKKFALRYDIIGGEIILGSKVRMNSTQQVAIVKEINGKKAFLQLGMLALTADLTDLVVVKEKTE